MWGKEVDPSLTKITHLINSSETQLTFAEKKERVGGEQNSRGGLSEEKMDESS